MYKRGIVRDVLTNTQIVYCKPSLLFSTTMEAEKRDPGNEVELRSSFNGESFSRKVSELMLTKPEKLQALTRLQETNAPR